MVRKKMEGNEEQRRKKARDAKRRGRLPSAERATEGASKQRRHLGGHASHEEKLKAIRQGKQPDPGIHVSQPEPRPGNRA
jgi:hypothetical protein